MKNSTRPNFPARVNLESDARLAFLLRETVYAPLRLLSSITFGVAIILGLGLGLALGALANDFQYYLVKETTLAAIGGATTPLFLIAIRRIYHLWRGRAEANRPVSYLMYYLAGALAGLCMVALAVPNYVEPNLKLALYPLGVAGLFPIVGLFADYLQEQRQEQQRTKEIFGKYVSKSIARRILDSYPSISLEGEKRQATVLISDIRGFTRMIQERGAEEVVHTLNQYFARMIDIIFTYDGTVNKFIGDAIVVLYGAPLAIGDETWRAIQTARAMQREVQEMNRTHEARRQPPLHIGIAIDSGEVVVGNIGSPRRLEYTAIGAPVNTAYFLAGLAPADTIYITENIYQALAPRLSVSRTDSIALKGDTGELNVYTLDATVEPEINAPSNLPLPTSNIQVQPSVNG